jgi:hypothetical protein
MLGLAEVSLPAGRTGRLFLRDQLVHRVALGGSLVLSVMGQESVALLDEELALFCQDHVSVEGIPGPVAPRVFFEQLLLNGREPGVVFLPGSLSLLFRLEFLQLRVELFGNDLPPLRLDDAEHGVREGGQNLLVDRFDPILVLVGLIGVAGQCRFDRLVALCRLVELAVAKHVTVEVRNDPVAICVLDSLRLRWLLGNGLLLGYLRLLPLLIGVPLRGYALAQLGVRGGGPGVVNHVQQKLERLLRRLELSQIKPSLLKRCLEGCVRLRLCG